MLIAVVPLLFAIAGLLIYAFATNPKVQHIGGVLFWTGWLVVMFAVAGKFVRLG